MWAEATGVEHRECVGGIVRNLRPAPWDSCHGQVGSIEGTWTMRRSLLTKEQIIAVLREHEARRRWQDLCRRHGTSDATLCRRKAKSSMVGWACPRRQGCERLRTRTGG
jgi:hypothetical protein